MANYDFDFQRYVDRQNDRQGVASSSPPRQEYGDYAFSGDTRVLRRLRKMKPVHVVAEGAVRFWRSTQRAKILGLSEKVTRATHPEVYDAMVDCAHTLEVPVPTVYISRDAALGAGTYGAREEVFVVISSTLLELLEPAELKFVLGHQCGRIQNGHVPYQTSVMFLSEGIGAYLQWAVGPATVALKSWSRRGEITCDRAGVICARSEVAALRGLLKMVTGSREIADHVSIQDYTAQLEGMKEGVGRFGELFSSHSYLPKRIKALELFVQSSHYRTLLGERGGTPLDEVDREVEEIIKVI